MTRVITIISAPPDVIAERVSYHQSVKNGRPRVTERRAIAPVVAFALCESEGRTYVEPVVFAGYSTDKWWPAGEETEDWSVVSECDACKRRDQHAHSELLDEFTVAALTEHRGEVRP